MKKFFKIAYDYGKKAVKKVKGVVAGAVAAVTGSIITSQPAHAALDLTGVSVDTADYITIATFLITALVAFWGIKKGIGLLGR